MVRAFAVGGFGLLKLKISHYRANFLDRQLLSASPQDCQTRNSTNQQGNAIWLAGKNSTGDFLCCFVSFVSMLFRRERTILDLINSTVDGLSIGGILCGETCIICYLFFEANFFGCWWRSG
jgi:hypothetical protein